MIMTTESFLDEVTKNNEPYWLKEFRSNSLKSFENLKAESTELFKHQSLFNDFNLDEFQNIADAKKDFDFNLTKDVAFFCKLPTELK